MATQGEGSHHLPLARRRGVGVNSGRARTRRTVDKAEIELDVGEMTVPLAPAAQGPRSEQIDDTVVKCLVAAAHASLRARNRHAGVLISMW